MSDEGGEVVDLDEWDDDDIHYEDCGLCGGDHWYTRYEEDPLWYGEDELFPCPQCNPDGKLPWSCP